VFIFLMLHLIFPSPAIDVLGPHANKFSINQWNAQHGFDEPWLVQYLRYLNQLLHGNLGYSYKLNQSVAALFQERWLRSAYLSGVTLFLSVVIAIPLGIYQAVRRNTVGDSVVTTGAFVTYAMPDFFLYLIAIQLFAISIPIFSYEGPQTTSIWSIITDAADRLPDPAGAGRVLPVHAVGGDRHAGRGLHQGGPGQGPPGAAGPVAAPGPQRLPPDDHPDRPVDPGAAGRQPDL
jgi:ABC-type dipeptide/oligopeptide/nickel transport system permease component